MARQKTNPLEDLASIASKLPWWIGVMLALVSYLMLHALASQPLPRMTSPEQMGAMVISGFLRTFASFAQLFIPLAFGIGASISAFQQFKRRKLYDKVSKSTGLSSLNEMSWGDFERLVGEYYRRKGFRVTHEGASGPDGGIDLVLRQKSDVYLVQCKQWKAYRVGVQPVRELYGVMASRRAAGGYFVTSGEFTAEAKNFARGLNIELVDGRKLRGMIDTAQHPAPIRIADYREQSPAGLNPIMPIVDQSLPKCPICGAEMKKRTARKGPNPGQEFYGCVAYPTCKGILQLDGSDANLKAEVSTPQPVKDVSVPQSSYCPDCGTEMALRQFQSGPRSGQQFYGCVPCKKGWPIGQIEENIGVS